MCNLVSAVIGLAVSVSGLCATVDYVLTLNLFIAKLYMVRPIPSAAYIPEITVLCDLNKSA